MPIEHHQGDLLTSDCEAIAHGCNCFNTMGAGIAKQIKMRYPMAYEADCETIAGDKEKLGDFSIAFENDRMIFNLYTQYNMGRDLSYPALESSLRKLKNSLDFVDENQNLVLGLPRIGCGIAGGDWPRVEEIINNVFAKRTVRVYTL